MMIKMFVFIIVYEVLVDQSHTTWSGVVTREIPVAGVVRNGVMQPFYTLENQFNGRRHTLWTKYFNNLLVDFLNGERLVDSLYCILDNFPLRFSNLFLTSLIDFIKR